MTTARDTAAPKQGGWHFRFLGFAVSVPWNALIGVVVIAALWYPQFAVSRSALGQVALAAVFAVLLMASVLFHELAHAFVAQWSGYPVAGITLWAMGGFTTYHPEKRLSPGREALIALAGPAATLAIAALAYSAAGATPPGTLNTVLGALAWANALVGLFNLLPGSPLDGGAVVKSAVWAITGSQHKGTVVSGWVGRVLAVLIVLSPFLLAWQYGGQPSLTLIVVAIMLGWLLWSGASQALAGADAIQGLSAVPAGALARPIVLVGPAATVADTLPVLQPDRHVLVTDDQGRPVGAVSAAAARAVPGDQRERVTAWAVSARLEHLPVVSADATALDVLNACQRYRARFIFLGGPAGVAPQLAVDTDETFATEGP